MSTRPILTSRRGLVGWLSASAAAACVPSLACAPGASPCPSPRSPAPPPEPVPPGLLPEDLHLLASPGTELPIVQRIPDGSNVLRRVSRELRASDDAGRLEQRMRATLLSSKGVGLAAPQIGIGARAILVMHGVRPVTPGGPTDPHVEWYVNPRIAERSDDVTLDYEGCLSVADVCGLVRRHRRVVVEHGVAGAPQRHVEVTGFDARIFQHEIDHLDGVLYVDRVEGGLQPKERLKELRDQLRRDHPQEVAALRGAAVTSVL